MKILLTPDEWLDVCNDRSYKTIGESDAGFTLAKFDYPGHPIDIVAFNYDTLDAWRLSPDEY